MVIIMRICKPVTISLHPDEIFKLDEICKALEKNRSEAIQALIDSAEALTTVGLLTTMFKMIPGWKPTKENMTQMIEAIQTDAT